MRSKNATVTVDITSAARHARSRILRHLLALALGLGLTCIGLEGFLRVFAPQPRSWLEIFRLLPDPLCFGLIPGAKCVVDTGDSRWSVETDQEGRRVGAAGTAAREPAASAIAARGIVPVIGDSFVFGHGVEYGESFVARLDDALQPSLRFRDEGVPGYGPVQYEFLVQRDVAEPTQPRGILVVSYIGNDFFDCVWDKHVTVQNGTLGDTGGLRSFLKRHVHSYRLASRLWHAVGSKSKTEDMLPMFGQSNWSTEPLCTARAVFEREFRSMRDECAAHSVPLLVVLIPPPEAVRNPAQSGGALQYDLPTKVAREVLGALQVQFVDTSPALVRSGFEKSFLRVDGHLSAHGNEIVRDCILEAIQQTPSWH